MPCLELQSGLRVSYADRGAGPALVFLHGWSFDGRAAEALPVEATAGRRVIAPDLRGHGGTPAHVARTPGAAEGGDAPPALALSDLAADLAGLLEALDVGDATLAGWSLGAQVAVAALPRVRSRVARLVLLSATPCFTVRDGWPHGLPEAALAALARRVARDAPRAVDRFRAGMFVEGELDDAGRARAAALLAATSAPDPRAALAGLDVLGATDLRPALAGVDLPALVLHGERDPICPAGAGRALAGALPRARLALVTGAGHAPFVSRPVAVGAALGGFLEGA